MNDNIPLPSKILIGISLDANDSKELLSWVSSVLAHPGDTIVAMHVIASTHNNKGSNGRRDNNGKEYTTTTKKHQKQIRQAKSFVISAMADMFKTCQSHEVNLEARVGLSSSVGKGLTEEAKKMEADYIIIGGRRRNRSTNRSPSATSRYIFEHAPVRCSLILVRRSEGLKRNFQENSVVPDQEYDHQSGSSWSEKNSYSLEENSFSSFEETDVSKKKSPRTVLDICEEDSQSNTDEETPKSEDSHSSSITANKQQNLEIKRQPSSSPIRRISSLIRMSLHWKLLCNKRTQKNPEQHSSLQCFTYEEIANATNHFHQDNLVGKGGYSEVYRGQLGIKKGSTIAVKRLTKESSNATKEKEFLTELGIIGHVNHPNTAKLVGCCIENGLYLVFHLYPNGTLSSALHGPRNGSLDWAVRYRIVLGIAKGLHYLHKRCKHRIIHRDIKASNILLGPEYEPQISDFGLAKWLPSKWTHHAVMPIEGTFGYLAPEYFMHGIVDEKTDVFAFGILLLEIVTGRRPVDSTRKHLLIWAKPLMESGKLNELADPSMEGRYDVEQLYRVVLTASFCVRQSSIWRPSMTEVLQLLTYGQDSETVRSRRIPKFTSDEMDDYSMIFGYKLPSDLALEDI